MNVTFFNDKSDINNPQIITLDYALERIKSGASSDLIGRIYKGDAILKSKLPCVCFGGEFSSRTNDGLIKHSGFTILDFDHTKDADDPSASARAFRESLRDDEFIFAAWMSPSMKGVKALVKIPIVTSDAEYKEYYNALLLTYPELDTSTTDISRISFESFDKNLWINESAKVWTTRVNLGEGESNTIMDVPLKMMEGAEKGEKHNTLLRASRLAGGYVGGGYIDEQSAIDMLESALAPCGYDITHKMHYKTIRDGISYGMSKPITLKGAVENRLNLGSTDAKTTALKFIRDPDYGWEKLEKFYDGNIELGVKTGYNFWDKHFQWKKNEFYSFTAPKGRGKTLLVTALQVIASICADWKWIIAAQENSVEDYKENLFRYLIHDDVNTVRKADPKKYMKVRRYINDHFIFIDVDTIEQALITAKYIGDNNKDDTYALFLDPINSFMAGYGYKGQVSYDNGAEIAKKLLDFSLTEFTVVITQHTIISKQRENNGVVSSVHAEGGWYLNKASYTCTINREQGSNESVFNIDNVRNRKTGGKETKLSNSFILEWSPYDINIRMEELGSDSQTNVLKNLQQKHRRHE